MSREIERKLKGFKLERLQMVKTECFGRSNNILQMDLHDVIINAVELNKVKVSVSEYNIRINSELVALSRQQVYVFTDGSVYNGQIGCGVMHVLPLYYFPETKRVRILQLKLGLLELE